MPVTEDAFSFFNYESKALDRLRRAARPSDASIRRRPVGVGRSTDNVERLTPAQFEQAKADARTEAQLNATRQNLRNFRGRRIDRIAIQDAVDQVDGIPAREADVLSRQAERVAEQQRLRQAGAKAEAISKDLAAKGKAAASTVGKVAGKVGRVGRLLNRGGIVGSLIATGLYLANEVGAEDVPTKIKKQIAEGLDPGSLKNQIDTEISRRRAALLEELEVARLRRATQSNIARLQEVSPDIYNSLLAGRQLPRGAQVFGGVRRQDIVEQVAYDMARGAITNLGQEGRAEEQIAAELERLL